MKPRPDLAIENADGELIVLDKEAGKVHQLNSSLVDERTRLPLGEIED